MEEGETPEVAIFRELNEELEATSGQALRLGPISLLGDEQRTDRPWTEHVFHASVNTPHESLRIKEDRAVGVFSFEECSHMEKIAPHHLYFIEHYKQQIQTNILSTEL